MSAAVGDVMSGAGSAGKSLVEGVASIRDGEGGGDDEEEEEAEEEEEESGGRVDDEW